MKNDKFVVKLLNIAHLLVAVIVTFLYMDKIPYFGLIVGVVNILMFGVNNSTIKTPIYNRGFLILEVMWILFTMLLIFNKIVLRNAWDLY